ncbi:MAG: Hpt domain-containing protein, partial [Burkholderiales bacterium]
AQAPSGTASIANSEPCRLIFDPDVLAKLPMVADGSQPRFPQEMLQLFESASAAVLDEFELAFAGPDAPTLLRCVHTLKSSSAQVGALELAAIAAGYEQDINSGRPAAPDWLDRLRAARSRLLLATGNAAEASDEALGFAA